jgi:hypothetical protein
MIATDENLKRLCNRCFTITPLATTRRHFLQVGGAAQRSGSKIRLEKFAQRGEPPHATPVALSRETRRQLLQRREPPSGFTSPLRRETRLQGWIHRNALAQLFAKSKIQNGIK